MGTIGRIAILLLLVAVSACHRIQPIYSVQDHPIPSASLSLSAEQITQTISRTAQTNGWSVEQVSPTELRATQKWKDHTAVVLISTNGRSFSIREEGSTNLRQQGNEIHRAYNTRVHTLEDAIDKRLYQRP